MRCLVTGAAGFIGSTLVDKLLAEGHDVVGIDKFVPYYPRELKERNIAQARGNNRYRFLEADLSEVFADADSGSTKDLLDGTDAVYHQAAQAGVRASWGKDFEIYADNNVVATQKLLEACRRYPKIRVVYASSSSVYGETDRFPMAETDLPKPVSPYGVSKLAAEHLMTLYHANFQVETVSLRYFTVYGPRQRPDMAFNRIIKSLLTGAEFNLFGTGEQTRDFTFVQDIVQGNIDASLKGKAGGVYNLGGGNRVSMNEVIAMLEDISGRKANVVREARQSGDVTNTGADVSRAHADFNFSPKMGLREGLEQEVRFIEALLSEGTHA